MKSKFKLLTLKCFLLLSVSSMAQKTENKITFQGFGISANYLDIQLGMETQINSKSRLDFNSNGNSV